VLNLYPHDERNHVILQSLLNVLTYGQTVKHKARNTKRNTVVEQKMRVAKELKAPVAQLDSAVPS
jgi:hypothetical protein